MPNGGSDNCGTCWFNSVNDGKSGYPKNHDYSNLRNLRCLIRDLEIPDPFWTYCVNHPGHNRDRVEVPIGPVYRDAGAYPYRREVLQPSPDTEEIRRKLLELLDAMPEKPRAEYPTAPKFDVAVIIQLAEFIEPRAVAGLRRVTQFNPLAEPEGENPFKQHHTLTVAHAIQALATIVGDEALPEIERGLRYGREEAATLKPYDPERDPLAVIRYFSVNALKHCRSISALGLAQEAAEDPNGAVQQLAGEYCRQYAP